METSILDYIGFRVWGYRSIGCLELPDVSNHAVGLTCLQCGQLVTVQASGNAPKDLTP